MYCSVKTSFMVLTCCSTESVLDSLPLPSCKRKQVFSNESLLTEGTQLSQF